MLAATALAAWLATVSARAAHEDEPPPDDKPLAAPSERPGPGRSAEKEQQLPQSGSIHLVSPEEKGELKRHLHKLEVRLRELKEAGKHDEAERADREIRETRQRLAVDAWGAAPHGGALPTDDRDRCVMLLREAAENARAAGMESEANRIQEIVKQIGRVVPTRGQPSRDVAPMSRDVRAKLQQMQRHVQDLRQDVKELREDLRQMRQDKAAPRR